MEIFSQVRWRTGRSVGRTVYAMVGVAVKRDILIGVMDTAELATAVVRAHNVELERGEHYE